MTVIYLLKKGLYIVEFAIVCVKEEQYANCKLFKKYTHKLQTPTRGNIFVFESENGSGNYLTLKNGGTYSSAKLKHVEVYFNKHDTSNTPLLFVLHFQNGSGGNGSALNKYYRMSNYTADATGCKTKSINELCDYKGDESILCDLIQENDSIPWLLTYDIMQRPNNGTNGVGTPCTYNCNKINVTKNGVTEPTLTSAEFTRFKHEPNNNGRGNNGAKKACLTYRCQALMQDGKTELEKVQGVSYTCIKVYFGQRAKRPCTQKDAGVKTCKPGEGSTCTTGQASSGQTCTSAPATGGGNTCTTEWQDVPLLLELVSNGDGNNPDYYVHRRKTKNGDQYYWVKLTLPKDQENGQNGLKQLLDAIGLSNQLSGNGTTLQSRLGQTANGSENGHSADGPTYLELLLKRLEFDLTDSVVILLDKKDVSSGHNGGYNDAEIGPAIKTLDSGGKDGTINPLKLSNGQKITLTDPNGTNTCLTKYKYRVVAHDFNQADTKLGIGCHAGLRFLIPKRDNGPKYAQLKLYPGDTETKAADLEYKYYQNGVTNGAQTEAKVYVVFYQGENTGSSSQGDPRPLLLCYQNNTYKPKGKDEYFEKWVKVTGVQKCLCQNGGVGDTSNGKNEALLKAVTGVVGFLNKVDLCQHPGTSTGAGQTCQNSGASGATCQTGTNGDTSCTYTVHQFNGSDIKVQVKCSQVNGSNASTCYKKLTHQPIGINGKGATNGFRLGDVEYCRNGGGPGSRRTGSIKYYPNGRASTHNGSNLSENNKYNPLVKVHAYFYDADTKYCDPLLVVLEFATNGVPNNNKECYKLTNASGSLEWEKDEPAKNLVSTEGPELVKHLDEIRYCLKKVVKVELHRNGNNGKSYALMGRDAKSEPGSEFRPINGGQTVTVQVAPCPALTDSNYRCVKHNLENALRNKQHLVAGLAFTLPGTEGKVIEIPLYNGIDVQCAAEGVGQTPVGHQVACPNGSKTGQTAKITYNQCMGDVCVYFYDGTSGDGSTTDETTDTVPLMLRYNKRFYRPQDRDKYFDRWECVTDLTALTGECGCPGGGSGGHGTDCQQLVDKLNEINLALNQIDLYLSKVQDYGLPENGGHKLDETVGNERVKVATQTPSGDGANAYERVVHRTKNGFLIGEITYSGKDITSGITPKGENGLTNGDDTKIPIANGGHKAQVSANSWNTVAAYYSKTDTQHKLPQLIVILKTDQEVQNGSTVTGSKSTAYGYYVLATQNGGQTGYQYEWRMVNGTDPPTTPVKLDDATDFKLLNSAVILTHWRDTGTGGGSGGTYGEQDINKAIESAIKEKQELASPGNSGKVNRLTGKNITVKDETSTGDYTCLSGTEFKVWSHDITNLVELSGTLKEKLNQVKLIAGLRFLTPTSEKGKYKQLTLNDNGARTANGSIKYHQPKNGDSHQNNKVFVFFYCDDPRPLLVCYNGWAYAAKTMEAYDKQEWHKPEGVTKCGCAQTPTAESCENCKLLTELVRVSDFLNPVYINLVVKCPKYYKHYFVQEFNGQLFWILVTAKPACGSFCFDRYTHTHAGTKGRNRKGFRLGNIHYRNGTGKDTCIKENGTNNGNNNKCISASQGNTGDQKCKAFPFVVVFYYKKDRERTNPIVVAMCTGTCNKLKCELYYVLKNRADKKYTKGENSLTMNDPEQLGKELDAALFTNSKQLQVILAQRPVPRDYKAEKDKKCENDKPEESSSQGPYVMDYHENVKKMAGLRSCNVKTLNSIATAPDSDEKKTKLKPMLYHVLRETEYQAQLYDPEGGKPATQSSPPSTLKITVKEVDCSTIYSDAGYRCFQHRLMNTQGIEDVGGLKLAVFDRQGTQDLQLCTGGKTGKLDQITYTVCKGDLYVFFYGEDPRPLMLCYDNHAYRPRDMAGYCTQWVKVDGATTGSGQLEIPFRHVEQVLKALYQVSVFMNPVRLCLGKEAIQAMEHEKSDPPTKPGEYLYVAHAYPPAPVRVRVTPRDLHCYRVYTHKPAIQGFRLGAVTYAGAVDAGGASPVQGQTATCTASQAGTTGSPGGTCSPAASGASPTPAGTTPYCFEYDSSKQLLSVCVYYYMYDLEHKWPLVVELGFRGQSSEFYRLCSKPDSGSNGTPGTNGNNGNGGCKAPSGLKWVRMTGEGENGQKSDSCANGSKPVASGNGNSHSTGDQGDCGTCPPGADTQTDEDRKETCKKDAEFVKRAREIHHAIYSDQSPPSVFLGDRVPLESDLNDLIEQRALEIRNQLGIKYTKDDKCLILATSSRCWEDSIMAYVVGGGVLGVAGGGGWKAVMMFVGVFVKL